MPTRQALALGLTQAGATARRVQTDARLITP